MRRSKVLRILKLYQRERFWLQVKSLVSGGSRTRVRARRGIFTFIFDLSLQYLRDINLFLAQTLEKNSYNEEKTCSRKPGDTLEDNVPKLISLEEGLPRRADSLPLGFTYGD